jgi:hypothetical protein
VQIAASQRPHGRDHFEHRETVAMNRALR